MQSIGRTGPLAKALCSVFLVAACGAPPSPTAPLPPPAKSPEAPKPTEAPRSPYAYPPSRRTDDADVLHGVRVADPYRWLEDEKSPETKAWVAAEDAFGRAELAKLPERAAIAARLHDLFYVDKLSAPRHRGSRFFYGRNLATKEKAVVYWREGKAGAEKVLFDPNTWSSDGSVSLGNWHTTWDGKRVAYTVKKNNSDEATLYVMDVASGEKSKLDVIEGAKYAGASWTPDGNGFYYTWLPTDPNIPSTERSGYAEVRYHALGRDPVKDPVVLPKIGDPSMFQGVDVTRDGHWLVRVQEHGWSSNDAWIADVRASNGRFAAQPKWVPLAVGRKAHFNIDVYKDQIYVATDDGAPQSRVFKVDPKHPERDAWKEIIPERSDTQIQWAQIIGGKVVVATMKNAAEAVEIRDLDGKLVRVLEVPGIGTIGFAGDSEHDEAYYSFESFTVPVTVFATSMQKGGHEVYSKPTVPVDPAPFTVSQVFYPSKDGTKISMFIVHRKDAQKNGLNRVLLYGYGGFRATETSYFNASIYPWLERGGVYAVPNLRGGAEYGEEWHKAGMLDKKQNVFDDFIAAAEHLVSEGWTTPKALAIYGASNGGLLVGAASTQRPDLYGAVICGVPLLDMVRYHKFGSGKTWTSEYGSADDAAQFNALYKYSPYHHVATGTTFPAFLMMSADSDDRVDPMHARKFAALLQNETKGGPVLVRVEKNSGHGGADMMKANVEKTADRLAFTLAHTTISR